MITVIIERHMLNNRLEDILRLLTEEDRRMRCTYGCAAAETIQSTIDPKTWLSYSTWASRDHWKSWKDSQDCEQIEGDIEPNIASPEKISII